MESNSLGNPARSSLALRRAEGPALPVLPALSVVEGSVAEGSGAEVEPPCGRERTKSRRACPERSRRTKSRAEPRDRERSRKTCPACPERSRRERAENPPFLIATRTYSPEKLTRRKNRVIRFSNRHKIHFVFGPHSGAGGPASAQEILTAVMLSAAKHRVRAPDGLQSFGTKGGPSRCSLERKVG